MTRRLYYEDAHRRQFEAQVRACEKTARGYEIVLDQTCFYPEGGGQPADHGTLGGAAVTDVHTREDEVVHLCSAPLTPGARVVGEIDWARRFGFMQLHSGEHILSGVVHRRFGYDNVGFHMGADFTTIDFSGPLRQEELKAVEDEANRIIWENRPVEILYPTQEALQALSYRSKKALSGQVRIVRIPEADSCACCGTHVSYTGEIGLVKIFSCVRFHEGVRLEILCGGQAFSMLRLLSEENRKNSALLSARPLETAQALERLLGEQSALKQRAAQLEGQLFALRAQALAGKEDVLLFEDGLQPDGVRRLADRLLLSGAARAAVFSGSGEDGFFYAIGSKEADVRPLVKRLNEAFGGRGGGKGGFCQGSVRGTSRAQLQAFFETEGGGWR